LHRHSPASSRNDAAKALPDVAVQTPFAIFGTKRAILTGLLELRIAGDEDTTALTDRDEGRAMERR